MAAGGVGLTRPLGDKTIGYFTGGLGYSRPMKVAAYQAPLLAAGSLEAIDLIEERVAWCESEGVSILCCPEAVLGGLADYAEYPARFAIRTDDGQLARVLAPLTSDSVTSIVGFAELADNDQLYNAAGSVSSRSGRRSIPQIASGDPTVSLFGRIGNPRVPGG